MWKQYIQSARQYFAGLDRTNYRIGFFGQLQSCRSRWAEQLWKNICWSNMPVQRDMAGTVSGLRGCPLKSTYLLYLKPLFCLILTIMIQRKSAEHKIVHGKVVVLDELYNFEKTLIGQIWLCGEKWPFYYFLARMTGIHFLRKYCRRPPL